MSSDPVLIAYAARRMKNGKSHWTRIGEAFPHDTGHGLTVKLDSVPLDGIIILIERDDHDDERLAAEASKQQRSKDV